MAALPFFTGTFLFLASSILTMVRVRLLRTAA